MKVRPLDPAGDHEWAASFLDAEMGGRMQARLGELIDVLAFPGFVAERDGTRIGLLTYDQRDEGCEVAVIAAAPRHSGAGTALVDAVRAVAVGRLWLITTNDNVDALRFYQRRGFRIAAVHRGGVDRSRELKPHIPLEGEYGIPLRDELELELAT